MKTFIIFTALILPGFITSAKLSLPRIFTDGMVLQRDQKIPVWGKAIAFEKINVRLKNQEKKTVSDKNGNWQIFLNPEIAGGPFQLTVKGENTILINDVLIGDVWICSGQSNMEFPVAAAMDAEVEIKSANYSLIRQFKVPVRTSLQPLENLEGGDWKTCSPATVAKFTAVGYFFGRDLQNELKVPIGLINASCGGTIIETWISKMGFEKCDLFKQMILKLPDETVEEINGNHLKKMMSKIDSSQGGLPKENQMSDWMKPDFDDANWPGMNMPGIWETKGWPELDGKVWFRKKFIINKLNEDSEAVINLGTVDDNDVTYINGVKVGATDGNLQKERQYRIPNGLLKNGANLVAVQIEDVIGGGGFTSDDSVLHISYGRTKIPLAGKWRYKIATVSKTGFAVYPDDYPTLLFNGMIYPLIHYGIKGVIWYQGESNTNRAFEYRTTFPLLIKDWRQQWRQGDFPFLFVQLSSFNAGTDNINESNWAELREAQTMALNIPFTGMAVTIDIGNPLDIHPKNKQEVGRRLSDIALNKVYGKQDKYLGPSYDAMKIIGNKIQLSFKNVDNGIIVKNKYGYLKGFKISGDDKQFYFAHADIEGKNIVVWCDSVKNPVEVRYAWADSPDDANIYNNDGFPLVPFRTDNWKEKTVAIQYHFNE